MSIPFNTSLGDRKEYEPVSLATSKAEERVRGEAIQGDAYRTAFGFSVSREERIQALKTLVSSGVIIGMAVLNKYGIESKEVGLNPK